MCLSCACGQPNEDHGDKRNITMNSLQQAADAAEISVDEVCENIEMGLSTEAETAQAD